MEALVWLILGVVATLVVLPRYGFVARWRRWEKLRRRARFEDALKHLLAQSERGQAATAESVAGALGLGQKELVGLIARMESRGMLHSTSGALRLTAEGERHALQVVRAHRLWERYLADEAGVPLSDVHHVAEKAEHGLSPERLDALDAHLGHPLLDPHGDPIPRADGSMVHIVTTPLTDWPTGKKALVVHVEDEPEIVLQQILALGLKPGSTIRVIESGPSRVLLTDGENEHHLAPVVAANVHVRRAPAAGEVDPNVVPLAELSDGEVAAVVAIDPSYQGLGRRRLLDLGLTPSATVKAELPTAFGDPRAYRIRETVVALRNEQARKVWVRRSESQSATA